MQIYVVIEDIDDYPECGGGEYPDAVFLNYANADKYATRKKVEANARGVFNTFWRVETWETADEKEIEKMSEEILMTLRHIFDARIDNAADASAYTAWTSARDIVEYALAGNLECLRQFDYLETKED